MLTIPEMNFWRRGIVIVVGIALCLFALIETILDLIDLLRQSALFALTGLVLCFLLFPLHKSLSRNPFSRIVDWIMILLTAACCSYLVFASEDIIARAGQYNSVDIVVAIIVVLLVLEAVRRLIEWILSQFGISFIALRNGVVIFLGVALCLFTISEVNYPLLGPSRQRALFALMGLVLCFLLFPLHKSLSRNPLSKIVDWIMVLLTTACCSYLVFANEDIIARAGQYNSVDMVVAITGVLLVLEATRRSIGWILPLLAISFIVYALLGQHQLPSWLFPHRPYDLSRVATQCFMRSEGVLGMAMGVMFTYVFLFVLFGAFLEASGATRFIVEFSRRIFGNRSGASAKVAVLGSGMMGSLSGSAVANAVTTGTFTIPMMRSSGFSPHVAGGITAAAASGGALVPPIMGAGAYMMLDIVPKVTFALIIKAALIPAILYYFSLLAIVHFHAGATGAGKVCDGESKDSGKSLEDIFFSLESLTFFGSLGLLITLLLSGLSPPLSVTYSLSLIMVSILFNPRIIKAGWQSRVATLLLLPILAFVISSISGIPYLNSGIFSLVGLLFLGLFHPQWKPVIIKALTQTARNGISLISAAACVGIIIAIVVLTGVGTELPNAILPLADRSLLLALVAIMCCSIILGMGLPSVVCYLLLATLIGDALDDLGVPLLAAHLFIFYFGMMSMVTPPVALAAYASASIAGADIMRTGFAAFRFALVGFTLPYMFVYRPELLLLEGGMADVLVAVVLAMGGIIALAAGLAGHLFAPMGPMARLLAFVAAALALFPGSLQWLLGLEDRLPKSLSGLMDWTGILILLVIGISSRIRSRQQPVSGN